MLPMLSTKRIARPTVTTPWDHVMVLANRAPVRRNAAAESGWARASGGLVTALEPLARACRSTWVAHDPGAEPASDATPDGYRLCRVAMDSSEYRRYYSGFANEGLWPLCHDVDVAPAFRPEDFAAYCAANLRFSQTALREASSRGTLMLVQDYHLALTPRLLRQNPAHTVVMFWHVPWPRPRVFQTCPWATLLLDGLLGSHVVGFQTADDCDNFLGCAEVLPGASVDRLRRSVVYRGKTTWARVYPVGIEWGNRTLRACAPVEECRLGVRGALGMPSNMPLAVGVDRLDYTKGINEKFLAVERLLGMRPELRGRFVFAQVAEPSRDDIPAYRTTRARIVETAARINARFAVGHHAPIRLLERHYDPAEVYQLYRAADACVVGSLHDGMNLVAKEFVSARDDERGALVLSERAGAARQLRAALIVDPRSVEATASALEHALNMTPGEQIVRMRVLRRQVQTYDASWWRQQLLADAARARDGSL
jgi:trehalose 6-phosphate synthase